MATQTWSGGGARSWRARLRELLHNLVSEEPDEPAKEPSVRDRNDTDQGATAVLDEVLREASEARQLHGQEGGAG